MLSPVDYLLWFASVFFEAAVVVCLFRSRFLTWYLPLNICMLGALLIGIGRFVALHHFGFLSLQYRYIYYFSDALSTVLLYFAIMALYQIMFKQMKVSQYIRAGSIFLLGATALFSYLVIRDHKTQLLTRFAGELSQNLYFLGVVLTYLLWGALAKLRETRTRLVQLILALGIYFSVSAIAYALRNMFSDLPVARLLVQLAGTFLPLAWAYTFWRVPEEARLALARLAAPNPNQ